MKLTSHPGYPSPKQVQQFMLESGFDVPNPDSVPAFLRSTYMKLAARVVDWTLSQPIPASESDKPALAVGQTWRRRDGEVVTIRIHDRVHDTDYPFEADGHWYRPDGTSCIDSAPDELVELISVELISESEVRTIPGHYTATLRPLKGKYYGTTIDLVDERGGRFEIKVWVGDPDHRLSDRELQSSGYSSREEAADDCYPCDCHYESERGFLIASAIVEAINDGKTACRPRPPGQRLLQEFPPAA